MREKFWEKIPLEELTTEEWEALCDGCGRCCLIKLQDADTDELYYTNISCQYLCPNSITCTEYEQRSVLVPSCVPVTPEVAREPWLPSTCAYRLVAEGKPLADWHPLISGDKNSVHAAGMSVKGRTIDERQVAEDEEQEHVVFWVSADAETEEEWEVVE